MCPSALHEMDTNGPRRWCLETKGPSKNKRHVFYHEETRRSQRKTILIVLRVLRGSKKG